MANIVIDRLLGGFSILHIIFERRRNISANGVIRKLLNHWKCTKYDLFGLSFLLGVGPTARRGIIRILLGYIHIMWHNLENSGGSCRRKEEKEMRLKQNGISLW